VDLPHTVLGGFLSILNPSAYLGRILGYFVGIFDPIFLFSRLF
jgi:hypothetical protein